MRSLETIETGALGFTVLDAIRRSRKLALFIRQNQGR